MELAAAPRLRRADTLPQEWLLVSPRRVDRSAELRAAERELEAFGHSGRDPRPRYSSQKKPRWGWSRLKRLAFSAVDAASRRVAPHPPTSPPPASPSRRYGRRCVSGVEDASGFIVLSFQTEGDGS
jgi:hypothetical protein